MAQFIPDFVLHRVQFEAERRMLSTFDEWIAFRKRWFPVHTWPHRSSDSLAKGSEEWMRQTNASGVLHAGGGRWGRTVLVYDLPPAALYEYELSTRQVGDALRDSLPVQIVGPFPRPGGWAIGCPHCEISSIDADVEKCPLCDRFVIPFPVAE